MLVLAMQSRALTCQSRLILSDHFFVIAFQICGTRVIINLMTEVQLQACLFKCTVFGGISTCRHFVFYVGINLARFLKHDRRDVIFCHNTVQESTNVLVEFFV